MKKIIAMFSENAVMTREKILEITSIQNRFIDIETKEFIFKNPNVLSEYDCVLDCTNDLIFYNSKLNKKEGREVSEGEYKYLITVQTNKFIMAGPNIGQLTASLYNNKQNIIDETNRQIEKFNNYIHFLCMKVPSVRNSLMFQEAIETKGLILNDVMENPGDKIYKLVLKIPDKKELGVEYIVPDGIRLLNEFMNIKDVLK